MRVQPRSNRANEDRYLADEVRRDKLHRDKVRRIQTEDKRQGYERFLTYIANLQLPNERDQTETVLGWKEASPSFLEELRSHTEREWPEIWKLDHPEVRIHRMRTYLRRCWDSHNDRERLWHIHRAIEYCQTLRITEDKEVAVLQYKSIPKDVEDGNAQQLFDHFQLWQERTADLLDRVPVANSWLESALFHLQEMAKKASRKPLICDPPGTDCERPYFFSDKKGRKYCPQHRIGSLAGKKRERDIKRASWAKNKSKWRPK